MGLYMEGTNTTEKAQASKAVLKQPRTERPICEAKYCRQEATKIVKGDEFCSGLCDEDRAMVREFIAAHGGVLMLCRGHYLNSQRIAAGLKKAAKTNVWAKKNLKPRQTQMTEKPKFSKEEESSIDEAVVSLAMRQTRICEEILARFYEEYGDVVKWPGRDGK